jgi:hypothetical protein
LLYGYSLTRFFIGFSELKKKKKKKKKTSSISLVRDQSPWGKKILFM